MFYRPPECIPDDFNLLTYIDFNAFACGPATTEGFFTWKNDPQSDPAPLKIHLEGKGSVPVWFVHLDSFLAAVADRELYIGDFEAMPSLIKGTADYYVEELHPSDGTANNSMIQQVARGQLEDGRSFFLSAGRPFLGIGQGDTRGHAKIRFE